MYILYSLDQICLEKFNYNTKSMVHFTEEQLLLKMHALKIATKKKNQV